MKILFFVGTAIGSKNGNIGGDPSQVIGIIDGFQKLGHEVIYASVHPEYYLNPKDYNIEHISDKVPPIPKVRGILNQWNTVRTIEKLIQKHRPSLLYCFWPINLFISRLSKYSIPIVMICNMPWSKNSKKFFDIHYDKLNLKTSTIVSAVSEDITEHLQNIYGDGSGKKVVTNPNGVDIERFTERQNEIRENYGIDSSTPVIGFAGYFALWHRVDLIIRAVQELETDARLLLVGTGPELLEKELRLIAGQKHRDRIIFTGTVQFADIPKYYSACDILVVAQDRNRPLGSSMKLYEYMSMGKAVAAANVGQLGQVIKNEINGMLFEPEVGSLTATLDRLILDGDLREKIGKQARKEAVEHYSWLRNIDRIITILKSKGEIT